MHDAVAARASVAAQSSLPMDDAVQVAMELAQAHDTYRNATLVPQKTDTLRGGVPLALQACDKYTFLRFDKILRKKTPAEKMWEMRFLSPKTLFSKGTSPELSFARSARKFLQCLAAKKCTQMFFRALRARFL